MTDLFHAVKDVNLEDNISEQGEITARRNRTPFILRFPEAIIKSLLEEWLTLKDIAKLDTAMTSRNFRPQLLKLMEGIVLPSLTTEGLDCPLFRGGGEQSDYFEEIVHKFAISETKRSCEELYWLSIRKIFMKAFALVEIDDAFVETLAFPYLQDLHIFEGSERSIHHLTHMSSNFTGVYLYGITESVGIRRVAEHCPNLQHFSLADPKITNGVVDELLFMFEHCTELEMVFLNDVMFTDAECALLGQYGHLIVEIIDCKAETESAFSAFIDKCVHLTQLTYFCSGDDGVVLDRAAKTCTKLEVLLVDEVKTTNVADLSQNCPFLRSLRIYGFADDFEPSSLVQLGRNLKLAELDFFYLSLSEEALVAISRLGSVRELSCYDCDLGTCIGFRSFKDSPISKSLTSFYVDKVVWDGEINMNSGRNCVEGLACCSKLDRFTFNGASIDDALLTLLCTSCPVLKYISISIEIQHNTLSIDGLTRAIMQCKHLKTIKLTQTSINDGVMSTRAVDKFHVQLKDLRLRFPHIELKFTRR